MNLEEKEMISLGEKNYMILTTLEYGGIMYAFANTLDKDDEPTEEYLIFYKDNENLKGLEDMQLANILIPLFQKQIKEKLDSLNK